MVSSQQPTENPSNAGGGGVVLAPPVWMTEGDFYAFEAHGLQCFIVRHLTLMHLCGYVALPPSHPLNGVDYETVVDVPIHGDWTLSKPASECWFIRDGGGGGIDLDGGAYWMLGFDCAQVGIGDFVPQLQNYTQLFGTGPAVYRTMEFVERELSAAAEKLANYHGDNGGE